MSGHGDARLVGHPAGPGDRPRVLIAPDSFKGTFTAERAALALARGVAAAGLPGQTFPLADGGEDTTDAIRRARGGEIKRAAVHDPLGRAMEAELLVLPGGAT